MFLEGTYVSELGSSHSDCVFNCAAIMFLTRFLNGFE